MKKSKVMLIGIFLAAVVAGAVMYLNRPSEFIYVGTIEATKVDVPARVASVISARKVNEGDPVKQGQTLIELAGEDYKLAVDVAQRDYDRASKLTRDGSMPTETFDHLKSKRDLAALQADWCDIKSPLNGVVLNKYKEPGEWVTPGMKLLTLADLSEVWAMIYVSENFVKRLSLNMAVKGSLPDVHRDFEGRITHINDEAEFTPKNVQTFDERTRLIFGVKVTFQNPDQYLKPGMSIQVEIPKAK